MRNDYYEIAYNNLLYLQMTLNSPFYNDIAVYAQQIAEKMLKSVAEIVTMGAENLLKSHNLRALYDRIHEQEPEYVINRDSLSTLKDYYFDAKYPGENFVTVTREECSECLETMYSVIEQTNKLRQRYGLDVREMQKIGLGNKNKTEGMDLF